MIKFTTARHWLENSGEVEVLIFLRRSPKDLLTQPELNIVSRQKYKFSRAGPPSANPGPWAEASRALSYIAVTGPYYVDNVDIRGPAGPCWALPSPAGPLKVAGPLGFCPPCPPLSAGLLAR